MHTPVEEILAVMDCLNLNYAQVYEDYAVADHDKKRMILALPVDTLAELPQQSILSSYGFILLDAPKNKGLLGGSGQLANWFLASELAQDYPLILAGGLKINNVKNACVKVKPYAVDVASGIESLPGIKDKKLMHHFLGACHEV